MERRETGFVRCAAVLSLVVALAAAPALAAVEGSPHDLIAQGYDVAKGSILQDRCTRCHLSTGAGSPVFLPEVPPVLEQLFEATSIGCFSCHDGTTIVSPDVDASQTAFHPRAHGGPAAGSPDRDGIAPLGNRMACLTCHDPHDNGHRPFLRSEIQELCLSCHAGKAESGLGRENSSGNHPLARTPLGPGRPEVPIAMAPAFRVPFPAPYPLQRAKGAAGVHWALGGHLGEGDEGELACATCHVVHGDGTSPPRDALLSVDPVNDLANLLCEGCHAGERGDEGRSATRPNPGGTKTGRTYHPVDDDAANGEGRIVEVTVPDGWPLGGGEPARLLCTTCHASHGASPRTPLLRGIEEAPGFCERCHEGAPPEYHHPVSEVGACVRTLPPPPEGEPAGMRCSRCHRAHNAGLGAPAETRYVPLLRQENDQTACFGCHPEDNPTCGTQPDYQASHFMGDPLETYGDTEPPLRRDPWPESGLRSLYGSPEDRSVTCRSCHSFRKGALVSGDARDSGYLVARSGNPVEWPEGGETTYLCTGCHSVDPGTGRTRGHSHPMMNANAETLNRVIDPPATLTPGGRVNCDSCHRPHEALTRGGYYILERVSGANTDPRAVHPKIDFTALCHSCHDPGKY